MTNGLRRAPLPTAFGSVIEWCGGLWVLAGDYKEGSKGLWWSEYGQFRDHDIMTTVAGRNFTVIRYGVVL